MNISNFMKMLHSLIVNCEQEKIQLNYDLFLNKHKIIPSKQALFVKNGKWDICLYKEQPLVYTHINDSSDICIDFPIFEITYRDGLNPNYFRINLNGDEFFTKKVLVGGKLFIKESNSVTQPQIDILKFYLFCAYNLIKYSIKVQFNNLFILSLLLKIELLDGEELNTHEKLTKWMNNLYLLQKTLDKERPNSYEELFNWINNLHQMNMIDIISYDNTVSAYIVPTSQLEYKKLDTFETCDERILGIIKFKEKLSLKDWIGNAAYDNLINWTMDYHLFQGLITSHDYKTEISKKIVIDFIKIPKVNISNKFCLEMTKKLGASSSIIPSEDMSSFPFIKCDIEDYEGLNNISVKFEHYEILLDEDNVKPTKEFEQVIEKALDSMKPLEDLQHVFDEYGHSFPQRIILGRSLKTILPNFSLSNTFEIANDVVEIVESLDKLNVSYLITQEGESIEKDNITSWIQDSDNNLKVIGFDKIIPLYKILKEEQQVRIDNILDKFKDLENSQIIMTGITDLKCLDNKNIIHYKCIDVETPLGDKNYEVFGSIISENNIRLDNIYVNFGLYDFNGFYAIIKKSEEANIDIRKCYVSWMVVGLPSQLSVFSPNNRCFQINYFKLSTKLQPNRSNYCIKIPFTLSEGYTIFVHEYQSPTNYEPNNIVKLVKWSKNSINFQITNLSHFNLVYDFPMVTANFINIDLNICILSTDYKNLKIDNNEEKEHFLIGYILTKENFVECFGNQVDDGEANC
ncbi:hypothetical protein RhiirA4_416488 [Rhizophagus irregularis]|uniref:Uncharacterized protein n=1 Tax=Rhizophagus irregularis TaxID=588596 RepID=A0A2I1G3N7_9GLOM|nr:hypothetical protein RhiirA4_416488 [Rhizophagus irregularis]